jgi:TonB family protein
MNRTLLAALLLTLSSLLSASDKTHEGEEILEQARLRSDIRELPSFTMKATVKIENQRKLLEGEYELLWNGPNQWREEISFPGFHEVQIGGSGTVAVKRNLDFVPLRVHQLYLALSYGRGGLTLRPDERMKQVRTRKVNGIEARCVEITSKVNIREICVDASTGAVVRDHPFIDKEFAPVGAKMFPHILSYIEEGKTVAQAEVTELKTTEQLPSSAFEVPAGSSSKPSCMNPTVGRVIKRINPSYPESERRRQGTVAIYAVIGADGSPHNLRIVSGVSPGLNKASLDAVQQWRYEPYMCQSTPVEVETVIQVNYGVGY